jgi:hypothetical protein
VVVRVDGIEEWSPVEAAGLSAGAGILGLGEYNGVRVSGRPVNIFVSYAREDERFLLQLRRALVLMRREKLINVWYDGKVWPGSEISNCIFERMLAADVFLPLLSPDFMESDFCYRQEMQIAIDRHKNGESIVVPIVIRPIEWETSPLGGLHALPRDAKPITRWPNRDLAWEDVARRLRRLVTAMTNGGGGAA